MRYCSIEVKNIVQMQITMEFYVQHLYKHVNKKTTRQDKIVQINFVFRTINVFFFSSVFQHIFVVKKIKRGRFENLSIHLDSRNLKTDKKNIYNLRTGNGRELNCLFISRLRFFPCETSSVKKVYLLHTSQATYPFEVGNLKRIKNEILKVCNSKTNGS